MRDGSTRQAATAHIGEKHRFSFAASLPLVANWRETR